MIAPLGAVFVASLLGSLHCAGMCGPLACAATLPRAASPTPITAEGRTISGAFNAPASALYHAGRLTAYVTLGAAAGTLGSAIDLAGNLAGVQRVAAYLAAGLIILVGLAYLLKSYNLFRPPSIAISQPRRLWTRALSWPAPARAVVIGLLTGLLPCGWLWVFLVSAAGTASPLTGALTMAAFWLGTVPVLLLVTSGLPRLLRPITSRAPALVGVAIIAAGIFTLVMRVPHAPAPDKQAAVPSCCHEP
ncbi:MAG: sulfite exporter TauE/SafE family protein [Leptolyngbya sp. PLA1]|nr:sulfite exporter TauE/SafE family protein [Leptolyngbya sp. PLA1]